MEMWSIKFKKETCLLTHVGHFHPEARSHAPGAWWPHEKETPSSEVNDCFLPVGSPTSPSTPRLCSRGRGTVGPSVQGLALPAPPGAPGLSGPALQLQIQGLWPHLVHSGCLMGACGTRLRGT